MIYLLILSGYDRETLIDFAIVIFYFDFYRGLVTLIVDRVIFVFCLDYFVADYLVILTLNVIFVLVVGSRLEAGQTCQAKMASEAFLNSYLEYNYGFCDLTRWHRRHSLSRRHSGKWWHPRKSWEWWHSRWHHRRWSTWRHICWRCTTWWSYR